MPAYAADETVIEEIVVTGSRIPRTGFETLQPATVLDSEQIDLRGAISLAKLLNEQAGFATPEISGVGLQEAYSVGQNFVDFLGLGAQRTLTLVNGHRFPAGAAPNGTGGLAVDINSIPENLISRVETIAVGGAPIYGSDAVAGTVNIILKDDFEGFEVVGSIGESIEQNDAEERRVAMTWGRKFDRGNVAVAAQYTSIDGLRQTDRPATATTIGFETPGGDSPYAQEVFNDLTVAVDNVRAFPLFSGGQFHFNLFGNGIPLDINDPGSPLSQFDDAGNLIPFVPGGGTGTPIFQNGGDGLKLAQFTPLYNDIERFNVTVLSNFELTEDINLRAEAWFTRVDGTQPVNQVFYNSPAFGGLPGNSYGNVGSGPIPVLIDNPFLLPATRDAIGAALDIVHDTDGDGVADPSIDTDGDGIPDAVGFWRGGPLTGVFGDGPYTAKRDTYRLVLGLTGTIDFAGSNYEWDVSYTYGRNQSDDRSPTMLQSNFEQAIQVTTDGDGNPVCVDPSGGCVPLDVIGPASAEAIAYVSANVTDEVVIEQRLFTANISGDVFDLPAGPIGVAAGFAYREESAKYDPNDIAENGFARDPLVAISGDFDSTEFYAETVIPIVSRLEFEGAIRFVDNSVSGDDTTWTAGLRFRPIEDVELRGNLTESIRAPSITELFTPESVVFDFADDPCDARFIDQGNVPATRAANCAADGITQPFTSFIVNASQAGTLSGNANLVSEIAESTTYGIIVRPRFLDGFTASVDLFDIEIDNAIESLPIEDIMLACYDSGSFPDATCNSFTRDAANQVVDFRSGFLNVGVVEFSGIQTVISYDVNLGRFGDLTVGLNHLHTDKHTQTSGSGNTLELAGEIGKSDNRVNLTATWYSGKWTWFNQIRRIGKAVFDNSDAEFSRNVKGVSDWTVVDTAVVYAFKENIDFQITVDNLFDEEEPYPAVAADAGIVAYFPGIRGRHLSLSVRARY